jgi:tetratricopeptide (TPR) repeat protein
MKVLKIFVASGSELKEERDEVKLVLNKVGKSHPHIKIEAVEWETDIPSGSVPEPRIQGAINPILESCDMVLVLVYSRIGEFTREEYRLAMGKNKKVFVYFKTGFSPKNDKELSNYGHVLRFKQEIKKENRVLDKEFDSITMFESLLYQDLNLYISINYKPGPGIESPLPGEEKRTKMAIPLTLLPPSTVKFIGRERELEQLGDQLKSENRVLLVQGIGGIGKTELCKAFLWDHKHEYHYTGWIDYLGNLKSSFLRQIQVPGLVLSTEETDEQQFQILNRYLIGLGEEALLVVDNIDNPDDPDLNILAAYRFKVMANSRCSVEGFSPYEIEFLNESACKELFYVHYQGKRDAEEEKEVDILIRRAGSHTLAIELLARTAWASGLGVKDLNLTLDQVGFNLDRVIKENIRIQWQNDNVKRTFFQHLAKVFDLSRLAAEEKLILCNISLMPALPLEIADLKEWLGLESADVLNGLVEKGWLKRIGNNVEMHAVIGEVVRIKEKPGAGKCRKLIESLQWLFHLEPGDNPLEKRDYVVIGESVVQRLDDNDQELATLANNLSTIYQSLGKPERALEFQEKALKIRETVLDKNSLQLASSYSNLSTIYRDLGQPGQALEFQKKALKIREEVLYKNHPHLAQSYNTLSAIYLSLGQPDRALEFQEKALKIWEAVLNKNHPDLALSYGNLSTIYQNLGQPERALEFQEKALKIREAVLVKNHPDLARSYYNLSTIYLSIGKFEEALEYQEKALRIIEKSLPENHRLAADSYINLSLILKSIGRLDEALDYGKKGVEILKKIFPEDNPRLKSAMEFVALIRSIIGKQS